MKIKEEENKKKEIFEHETIAEDHSHANIEKEESQVEKYEGSEKDEESVEGRGDSPSENLNFTAYDISVSEVSDLKSLSFYDGGV